jgi:hypothetical protein
VAVGAARQVRREGQRHLAPSTSLTKTSPFGSGIFYFLAVLFDHYKLATYLDL